jgi:hypothetical protein
MDALGPGKTMQARSSSFIALVMLLCAPAAAGAWDLNCKYSAERELAVDTAGIQRVELVARAGDLVVRPGSGSTLSAAGKACASSEEYLADTQLRSERNGSVLQVFVQVPEKMAGIGMFYATLDLEVALPPSIPVAITDTSGDMVLEGVRVVSITDSSGDVRANGLPGDVEINDSSGDLEVTDARGAVNITDSSGDIRVTNAESVLIRTDSSGDIRLERIARDVLIEQDSSGDIRVTDVGGNLEVAADSSGTIQVAEVKGSVSLPANKRD